MLETILAFVRDAHPIVYFLLLMAAGTGLPVSEDVLAIWAGGLIGRGEAPYTTEAYVVALYCGVVLSDFWTFWMGRLAHRTLGKRLHRAVFRDPRKVEKARAKIQRYGDNVGFIQRLSIGARLPISFLSGYSGISPTKFLIGTCLGAMLTLPAQLMVGYAMRHEIQKVLQFLDAYGRPVAVFILVGLGFVIYRKLRQREPEEPEL